MTPAARQGWRAWLARTAVAVGLTCLGVLSTATASAEHVRFAVGEWAPYVSETRSDLGLHTARVAEVFARAGIDTVFEFMPWKRAFELTRTGGAVATFPWAFTPERQRDFHYSRVPVSIVEDHFFYRKDKFPNGITVSSFEDVKSKGLSMVGVTSYWYEKIVKRLHIDYHDVAGSDLAWRYLSIGRADLLLENPLVAAYELPGALGEDHVGQYASVGPIHEIPFFVLFSESHADGERLRDVWDQFAAAD